MGTDDGASGHIEEPSGFDCAPIVQMLIGSLEATAMVVVGILAIGVLFRGSIPLVTIAAVTLATASFSFRRRME